jgi:hypothetical protein
MSNIFGFDDRVRVVSARHGGAAVPRLTKRGT